MDTRNFTFMFYGFAAAWAIIALYAVILANRSSAIRSQLDNLRKMLQERDRK
jgi:CcmD family protein